MDFVALELKGYVPTKNSRIYLTFPMINTLENSEKQRAKLTVG